MRHWDKKLLSRLGTSSKFCECGRLFTYKIRTASSINQYFYVEKCVFCRGQGRHWVKKEQKLFDDFKNKSTIETIPDKPDKVSVPRSDVEVKESPRLREKVKKPLDTLFIF
jgi:hypothetical protein